MKAILEYDLKYCIKNKKEAWLKSAALLAVYFCGTLDGENLSFM